MKPLIINVRGNSGSGKTTLTREFMRLGAATAMISGRMKVLNYDVYFKGKPWVVLGSYENECGGCDTIRTQQEIIDRVEYYTKAKRNIWLEGLLISGMYGSLGEFSEQFKDRWVFAFLDTPLEVCLRRVQKRRDNHGTTKPFNPTNTINRHATIERTRERLLEMHRRVIMLPYHRPMEPLLKLIQEEV